MQYYYQHTLHSKAVWLSRHNYYVTEKVKVKVKCTLVQALRLWQLTFVKQILLSAC